MMGHGGGGGSGWPRELNEVWFLVVRCFLLLAGELGGAGALRRALLMTNEMRGAAAAKVPFGCTLIH